MRPGSRVSYVWEEQSATEGYQCGVSLHSHTSASQESLSFIHKMGLEHAFLGWLFARGERRSRELHNLTLNFESANWRPPLLPRMAYNLERKQIQRLGLEAMVSITDHDTMEAPLLLRTLAMSRGIPMSVEWTAPFGATVFHLGIHNLPSAQATEWMERLEAFTAHPSDEGLALLLKELSAMPQVLVVFNHPLWDLYKTGALHRAEVERFLRENGAHVHALELNGLRHARENREVMGMAQSWNQVLISGGDRHGMEPNANLNLTNATNFNEFVQEIRVERRSHILFMEQYKRPWEQRILDSTVDAVTDYPQFVPGWQRWDERAFHQDQDGVMRPMSEIWVGGRPPRVLQFAILVVRMLRSRTLGRALSLAFPGVNDASLNEAVLQDGPTARGAGTSYRF
jgi:hypothetical protein